MDTLIAYLEEYLTSASGSDNEKTVDEYSKTIGIVVNVVVELFWEKDKHGVSLVAQQLALPLGAALAANGISFQSSAILIRALTQLIQASWGMLSEMEHCALTNAQLVISGAWHRCWDSRFCHS